MKIGLWLLWLCLLSAARAASNSPPAVTWFPANESFRAWSDPGIFNLHPIPPAEYQATHPRTWALACCQAANPQNKLRLPCPAPLIQPENGWACWEEPMFKDLSAALQPLGEGTFACAVLADGKRCSNIVRIVIRHDYTSTAEPVVRVTFIDTPQPQIGLWIVPPTPSDPLLTNYVAAFPDLELDGTWVSAPSKAWDGPIGPLNPGQPYGITFWLRQYQPRPEKADSPAPKLPARLAARLVEREDDLLYDEVAKELPRQTYTSAPIAVAPDPRDRAAFEEIFTLSKSSPASGATAQN